MHSLRSIDTNAVLDSLLAGTPQDLSAAELWIRAEEADFL